MTAERSHKPVLALMIGVTATLCFTLSLLAGLAVTGGLGVLLENRSPQLDSVRIASLLALMASGVLSLVMWLLVRRPGRGRLVAVVLLAGIGTLGSALWWWIQPDPGPVRPVGAIPYFVAAGVFWVLGGIAGLITLRLRKIETDPSGRWPLWRLLGSVVALGLSVLMAFGAITLGRAYTDARNEYVVAGSGAGAGTQGPPIGSALTGALGWQAKAEMPFSDDSGQIRSTRFGIPSTVGDDVVMIDQHTGRIRWRYFRSDVDDDAPRAHAMGTDRVLVDWTESNLGYLVLDAATGQREEHWPTTFNDDDLDAVLPDGALLGHSVAKGSDSIVRVDARGRELWRFAPGRCKNLTAYAAGDVAVIGVSASCGDPDQIVGLDLQTGEQRWLLDQSGQVKVVSGTTAIIQTQEANVAGLTALDAATGAARWHKPIQATAGNFDCDQGIGVSVGRALVQVVCSPSQETGRSVIAQFDLASGKSSAISSDVVVDSGLTSDDRAVVRVQSGSGDREIFRLQVIEHGHTRRIPVDGSIDLSRGQLGIADDQVFIENGADSFFVLR